MFLTIAIMFFTGLIVGSAAYLLVPGSTRPGIVRTALVGVFGSLFAGVAFRVLFGTNGGLVGSVLGALFLIWAHRMRAERATVRA